MVCVPKSSLILNCNFVHNMLYFLVAEVGVVDAREQKNLPVSIGLRRSL